MSVCEVCFHHCDPKEGHPGFCLARERRDGEMVCANYGMVTSLALDPIEKKPLRRFFPGSRILSAGSYGCNLRCPFCQNYEISYHEVLQRARARAEYWTPEELADLALRLSGEPDGNLGLAFTYNEPLVGYEFVRDTAKLVHERGLKNVLVTNGTATEKVCREILPHIDAMNIDLKGFTDHFYRDVVGGDFEMTKSFIETAVSACHVELTLLVIPEENDSGEDFLRMTEYIAGLDGKGEIPLHISRFFPQYHMRDREATDVDLIYHMAENARQMLKYVYTGNC